MLEKWLPQAERFTAQIKTVDDHIKALERAEQEAEKRAREAENAADKRIDDAVAHMQNKIDGKDRELREAWEEAQKLRKQIYNAETLIGKIPLEVRDKLFTKAKKERGQENSAR